MNVGLTRAKLALYVVGNMQTLKKDADWNAFYEDAVERNRVTCLNYRGVEQNGDNHEGTDEVAEEVASQAVDEEKNGSEKVGKKKKRRNKRRRRTCAAATAVKEEIG